MSATQMLKYFFLFGPIFALAIFANGIYEDLHHVPDTVPSVRITQAGQGIMAVIGTFALVCYIPEFSVVYKQEPCSARILLFLSCVDFLIGSLLLLAVGLQSTYLPHTLSGCDDASFLGLGAPGNTTNLFRFVGQLNNETPQAMCNTYMTTWIIGVVSGAISLLSSHLTLKEARNPVAGRNGSHSAGIDAVGWLIGLIPWFLTTPIKFITLWLKKWVRRWSILKACEKTSIEMVILRPGLPDHGLSFNLQAASNPKLLEILSSYPIMTAIAEGLHYADLIQLSLVSKGVHKTIFPSSRPTASSSLKKHCCLEGIRTACWCCKTQICLAGPTVLSGCDSNSRHPKEFCATSKNLAKADNTGHLSQCTQYCAQCLRASCAALPGHAS